MSGADYFALGAMIMVAPHMSRGWATIAWVIFTALQWFCMWVSK